MKITRDHFMFLDHMTKPIYHQAGKCRLVMFEHMRNLGRRLMFPNPNNVNTCNAPSS